MNLPFPTTSPDSGPRPLISTYTILLLCGVLFGMCVSENIPQDIKMTFLLAGTTGLVAYLALSMFKKVQTQTQQQVAKLYAEERLERHAQGDSRVTERSASTPI